MKTVLLIVFTFLIAVAFPVAAQEPENLPQQNPPALQEQPGPQQQRLEPQFDNFDNSERQENDPAEFVDPREIQDALRQVKDLQREINRILKRAKKLSGAANEVSQLNELLGIVGQFEQRLRVQDVSRETLQEFWDAQVWESFNALRLRIEFPTEVRNINKDLKRLEKMVGAKNFAVDGLDMNAVREKISEIKNAVAQAQASFEQGDWENVQENMQVIYEGSHPGDMMGVLNQLREIGKALMGIKSEEVKAEIRNVLSDVFVAANGGEFREANMMLQDIRGDLWRILNVVKKKPVMNQDLRLKMRGLEQKVQEKAQQQENASDREVPKEPQSSLGPYKPYHSASIIEAIKGFFGL